MVHGSCHGHPVQRKMCVLFVRCSWSPHNPTDDNDKNYLAPNVHLQMSLTHRECDPPRAGDVHETVPADQIQSNW
jgi:hypothetical protein